MSIQSIADKSAIGLSALCAIHCLFFPLLLVFLPGLALFDAESVHHSLLYLVIPLSLSSLFFACHKHKKYHLLALGLGGIGVLLLALLSEAFVGSSGEKTLTLIGAALLSTAHFYNLKQCQATRLCDAATTN